MGGKGGRCVERTILAPSCADCLDILGASTFWDPQGLSRHLPFTGSPGTEVEISCVLRLVTTVGKARLFSPRPCGKLM